MSRLHLPLRLIGALFAVIGGLAVAHAATNPTPEPDLRGRLAIVIGNSHYVSDRYQDLANASNDAVKLSETLKRLNFEVATGTDLTAEQFDEIFKRYQPKLSNYSAVLIFYAGHGIQYKGENYLLPVDTLDPDSVEKLTERAVRLNDVISRFASRDRETFIFLDACRNSPLSNGAAGTGNGLAQVEVGENSFIAFATQPGNVTVDGTGDNSPFTRALLQSVEVPGLSISDMMIKVRNETERLTLGKQVPWDQSNLREQFYFTEEQVLDSRDLGATLNRILENPDMKKQLMVQLASADSDLQSAVLSLGKQMPEAVRSVSVGQASASDASASGAATPAGDAAQQPQQMASLSLGDQKATKSAVATDLQQLLVLGKGEAGADKAKLDLAHRIQTELARVGCYRQDVDGDWGAGSRKALADYFRRTNQDGESLEPSVDLLSDLFLRSGRICRQPVAAKPARTATVEQGDGARAGKAKAAATAKAKAAARRPAAPPPDIGAGIGIGGIF